MMHKTFDWRCPRIYMLEMQAVLQSFIPKVQVGLSIALYMKSLLLILVLTCILVTSTF
jgi:hypothetical protein